MARCHGGGGGGGGDLRDAVVPVVEDEEALRRVDGGVEDAARVGVEPVEVDAARVRPVVATHHAVRVQHRDDLEDEPAPERRGARVRLAHDEAEETVQHEAGGRLARVDPRAQHVHLVAGQRMIESRTTDPRAQHVHLVTRQRTTKSRTTDQLSRYTWWRDREPARHGPRTRALST